MTCHLKVEDWHSQQPRIDDPAMKKMCKNKKDAISVQKRRLVRVCSFPHESQARWMKSYDRFPSIFQKSPFTPPEKKSRFRSGKYLVQ